MTDSRPALDLATLERALALPGFDGRAAQRRMEPALRGSPPAGLSPGRPLRDAGALAYVFEQAGRLHMPLTLRHGDLRHHRGQVSLPGGRPDPGESLWETAIREAEEEIALVSSGVQPLGTLHPVDIPVSHSRLHVHIGTGPVPRALIPNPGEVERIELVVLDDLLEPALRKRRTLQIQGRAVEVPYFDVAGLFLWGATAMALSELAERLRRVRD
jgi:8-oxo-dGTP pyrophosphatase MutT (NUDIX family)